jgi:hypothetical protein
VGPPKYKAGMLYTQVLHLNVTLLIDVGVVYRTIF